MHYVKLEAKTLPEMRDKVEALLNELDGFSSSSEKVVNVRPTLVLPKDDEMIEVESPYSAGPNQYLKDVPLNTVIDNELDAEGIPWDSRIHSSSKAKIKNGTWKIARGISDEQAFPIKAELRARVSQATQNFQTQQEQPVVAPQPVAILQPAVQTPPVVAPPMPQMNQSGHTFETFSSSFPLVVSNLITDKKIDQLYVSKLCEFFKLANIWEANEEQKAMVFDQFVQYGFIQKVG